jgi:o-succinylbenzoate synthase
LRVAEACGLPCVVSSALETSVGLAAGVALAAALPELNYACGLATLSLLDGDVVEESLRPVDGWLPVLSSPPVPTLISGCRADEETTARWSDRYRQVNTRYEMDPPAM